MQFRQQFSRKVGRRKEREADEKQRYKKESGSWYRYCFGIEITLIEKKTRGEKLGYSVIRIQLIIQQQNNFSVPNKLGFRAKSYTIDKVQNIGRLMGVWDLGGLKKKANNKIEQECIRHSQLHISK